MRDLSSERHHKNIAKAQTLVLGERRQKTSRVFYFTSRHTYSVRSTTGLRARLLHSIVPVQRMREEEFKGIIERFVDLRLTR